MPISKEQLKNYNYNNIFIETGTGDGIGTLEAVKAGFKNIHTIEAHPEKYKSAKNRLSKYDFVIIYMGDSGIVLKEILKNIDEPVTFWLDSHISSGIFFSKMKTNPCPLLKELDAINNHYIKTHTILIDDIRGFRRGIPIWNSITLDQITKKISPDYNIYYIDGFAKNDILVAEIQK